MPSHFTLNIGTATVLSEKFKQKESTQSEQTILTKAATASARVGSEKAVIAE